MSLQTQDVFRCDRCGKIEKPRDRRETEDDDGFPYTWAKVTFIDHEVNWKQDLCTDCGNAVGQVIRRADVVVLTR